MKSNKFLPSTEAIQWASGHFLVSELPDNFHELSEEQVNKYIQDWICEDYELHEAGTVWLMIEHLAYDTVNNLDRITKEN
tara:strand:+ start:667 stop:906 length:240 start_codon:yes stop_codon:yes gene_type:complete